MVGKKRAGDKDHNRKCRNTKKASTELSLLSTAVHAAVFFFQLFIPMIIRLRHILSEFKIKHSLLVAAMMGNRVVMVFLV